MLLKKSWLPLLDEAKFRSLIQTRIADTQMALRTPGAIELLTQLVSIQSPFPNSLNQNPRSLGQGPVGYALTCGQLDICFPSEGWDAIARSYLLQAVDGVFDSHSSAGLFSGLSGLSFAVNFLSREQTRYRKLQRSLDEHFCAVFDFIYERDSIRKHGMPFEVFDVISGWAGILAFLLARNDDSALMDRRIQLIHRLVQLVLGNRDLPDWHTPANLCADRGMAERYPGGILNCGVAHGIAGPLAALSLAKIAGMEVSGLSEAIRTAARWLFDCRITDGSRVNWPAVIPLNVARPERDHTRDAWCYGAPGIARSLWLAGQAVENESWQFLAVSAFKDVLRRGSVEWGITSPTFCHGFAGLLAIALRFGHDTGDPEIIDGANGIARVILETYKQGTPLGFQSEDIPGEGVDNPGLLDGASGIMLTLLAGVTAVEPSWDRVFLLS